MRVRTQHEDSPKFAEALGFEIGVRALFGLDLENAYDVKIALGTITYREFLGRILSMGLYLGTHDLGEKTVSGVAFANGELR